MAVDTPAKIAILGAGPIGLEAALYARFLGYEVVVYERGQVCEHVRSWGHFRMFTPFHQNRSLLGWAAIQAHDETYQPPADDTLLTGNEWVERYLLPLSQTDLLSDHLQPGVEVLAVGKEEMLKHETPGHEDRGDWSFRILLRDTSGVERIDLADVVIDTTGVLGQPNWMGHGGIPAIGEIQSQKRIEYRFPDFKGRDRSRYAGKHTLLVGNDWIAALNLLGLAEIAREVPETQVTWITRGEQAAESGAPGPLSTNDPQPARSRLIADAYALVQAGENWLHHWSGTIVEAINANAEGSSEITLSGGEHAGTFSFDSIIANVGYRPNRELHRELQVREDFATESTLQPLSDNEAQRARRLVQPEANFYVLGAKSFGRDLSFTFADGLEQIRQLFTIIGDRESLDLYTGAKSLLRQG